MSGGERALPLSNWPLVPLGTICNMVMGQSPDGASYNSTGEGEPLLNGPTEFGPRHPTPVQWTTSPTQYAEAGDILLCVRGATTGKKNIADQRYCIGRGLAAMRGNADIVTTEFLYFVLEYLTAALVRESSGSTFPNLPREKIEQFRVPLPPLAQQQAIVRQLERDMAEVERLRAACESQENAIAEVPSAYLRQIFEREATEGWQERRLGDILRLRKDVIHPEDNPSGLAVFVGLEHIESHTGARVGGSLSVEMSQLTGRKPQFRQGDIVYGYLRPYLNKVWVAEFDGLCSVDQYVYAVNANLADVRYVAAFMRSPLYSERAPIRATPGQLPRIRTEEVAAVKIALPPLDHQQQVVQHLEAQAREINYLQRHVERQRAAIEVLPGSLLSEVFGEAAS